MSNNASLQQQIIERERLITDLHARLAAAEKSIELTKEIYQCSIDARENMIADLRQKLATLQAERDRLEKHDDKLAMAYVEAEARAERLVVGLLELCTVIIAVDNLRVQDELSSPEPFRWSEVVGMARKEQALAESQKGGRE